MCVGHPDVNSISVQFIEHTDFGLIEIAEVNVSGLVAADPLMTVKIMRIFKVTVAGLALEFCAYRAKSRMYNK